MIENKLNLENAEDLTFIGARARSTQASLSDDKHFHYRPC